MSGTLVINSNGQATSNAPASSSSSGGSSYTPAQVAAINAARDANVNAGRSAYSGSGATANSIATGQTAFGTGTPLYAAPSTINSSNAKGATPINIPPPPVTSNTGTNAMTQAAGTAAAVTAANPPTPAKTPTPDGTSSAADSAFQTYLKNIQAPPDLSAEYATDRANSGVDAAQQQVNTYQAQLSAITAKAQADKLSLVGTGNGVPQPIIGGQQAEIDREAAIQALPVSAQLAAAQGNLTLAQDNLDTLFKIHSEDAQNLVAYNNSLVTAVYNFASDEQKTQLAALKDANDKAFTTQQNNLNYAQTLSSTAIQNGQSGLAAQIMKLNPTDPNYASNIAILAKGIVVQKAPSAASTAAAATAVLGGALSDANSAIAGGADPIAVRSAFLAKHPANAADWNAYFATTDDTKTTYPTPTPVAGPNLLDQVANWFKGL